MTVAEEGWSIKRSEVLFYWSLKVQKYGANINQWQQLERRTCGGDSRWDSERQ